MQQAIDECCEDISRFGGWFQGTGDIKSLEDISQAHFVKNCTEITDYEVSQFNSCVTVMYPPPSPYRLEIHLLSLPKTNLGLPYLH